MAICTIFPQRPLNTCGEISSAFKNRDIRTFRDACEHVHRLPYGYNSDRDDLMILFKENKGSCTTKHAVIATLAAELDLPVIKHIGIYAMTEELVSGTQAILNRYDLPYVPMVHCFLVYGEALVDLTADNRNGKNRPIEEFLHTEKVAPNISAKEEYLRYRAALKSLLEKRPELHGINFNSLLKAREEGITLLRANIGQ